MCAQKTRPFWPLGGSLLVMLLTISCEQHQQVAAQGVKGGSFSTSSNSQQFQQPGLANSGQVSSSFIQMFNSLTPSQQQQFISQMSSSNRKIFQQSVQPQTNFAFNEEVSSNSGSASPITIGGTKSFRSSSSSSSVPSPVQQAAFFRSQQSKSFQASQPIVTPSSQFSFSRQVSSQQQQPVFVPQQNSEFQSSRTVVNSVQPQQQSYFNRIQQVQQVAQPVIVPSSEQSFRRVQSFSSQPLPAEVSSFSQQFSQQQQQQQQPIQTGSNFNRLQQFSSSSGQQPIGGFNQQFSSSSNSLAGGPSGLGGFSSTGGFDGSGFSSGLQQEKVDVQNVDGFSGGGGGSSTGGFNNFNQQQQFSIPFGGGGSSSNFESSSSSSGIGGGGGGISLTGFDSADAQKNMQLPEDFYGVTAASINNKWYIMKPVENPSALGLGETNGANQLRQVPLSRAKLQQIAPKAGANVIVGKPTTSAPKLSATSNTASNTSTPKKRSSTSGSSSSTSLAEPEESESGEESRK